MLFLYIFFLFIFQTLGATTLLEEFQQVGYKEFCDKNHGTETYDTLYAYFDELIEFLQANPVWAQKLYIAKEHFIRSKDKNYYATDFFGFYDESKKVGRSQISFYYSIHFHEFICRRYPEFKQVSQVIRFFEFCREIQKPYENVFNQAATELGIETIFDLGQVPILFKVIKYFPLYVAARPHYDGTAFSLFLDSTDNESLLLSAYKPTFLVNDFSPAVRIFSRERYQNSVLLIPGTLLTEFSIYPTPHIVVQSGKLRYATIAFAMRPYHVAQKNEFSALPSFNC
jgi:hypothetical protein